MKIKFFFLIFLFFFTHSFVYSDDCREVLVQNAVGLSKKVPQSHHSVLEGEKNQLFFHSLSRDLIRRDWFKGDFIGIDKGLVSPFQGFHSLTRAFIRDYFPFQFIRQETDAKGKTKEVIELITYSNFLSQNGDVHFRPSYIPGTAEESYQFGSRFYAFRTIVSQILFEGGNILLLRNKLLVSEKIFTDNEISFDEIEKILRKIPENSGYAKPDDYIKNLKSIGYRPRSRQEVLQELSRLFRVNIENILVLPGMPGEATAHVDIFVGVIDDKNIALPYIPDALMNTVQNTALKEFSIQTNLWLDQQSKFLSEKGLNITRVPMVPPVNLRQTETGLRANFLSPVNWMQLDGTLYIPEYPGFLTDVEKTFFRNEMESHLKKFNLKIVYVPMTNPDLIQSNAGLHCLTAEMYLPPQ